MLSIGSGKRFSHVKILLLCVNPDPNPLTSVGKVQVSFLALSRHLMTAGEACLVFSTDIKTLPILLASCGVIS